MDLTTDLVILRSSILRVVTMGNEIVNGHQFDFLVTTGTP